MSFRQAVIDAAEHRGGLKMQPCLSVDPVWFAQIQEETRRLLMEKPASDVSSKAHPTNWTNPYGSVTQHSLYNDAGNTADTSTDHNLKIEGKVFAVPEFPALRRFFSAFSGRALNFRLNGLMPKSGLSPHEEHILHFEDTLRLRFHLPVFTNDGARGMLDGEQFHMKAGYVYFFNNGCVHSADNGGTEPRYHLVWDMFHDPWVEDHMCNLESPNVPQEGLRKLTLAEAAELSVSEPWVISQYISSKGEIVHLKPTR